MTSSSDFNSSTQPGISVILPVYNASATLDRCISGILEQSICDFELGIVDDGSTDGSAGICRSYAGRDSRIRVFSKDNGGVSSARNFGLENARGKYVAFCDSDDMPGKDWLMSLYSASAGTGLTVCGYSIHRQGQATEKLTTGEPFSSDDMVQILETLFIIPHLIKPPFPWPGLNCPFPYILVLTGKLGQGTEFTFVLSGGFLIHPVHVAVIGKCLRILGMGVQIKGDVAERKAELVDGV